MEGKESRIPKRLRAIARLILEQLEAEAWERYAWHGSPFGEAGRALDLWLEYGRYTTAN